MAFVVAPVRSTRGSPRAEAGSAGRRSLSNNLKAYALVLPALLCFALFSWYPTIKVFFLAFEKTNFSVGGNRFGGLVNCRTLIADPQFWPAWRNTFAFTGIALVIGFGLPFFVAVLLNELRHMKQAFRVVIYLPVMIPPVVTDLLWKWFYTQPSGLFDQALGAAHLPESGWYQSSHMALISIVLITTWANMGGTVLIYLAALQNIPGHLYEAAELDGANLWQRFRFVTVSQTRFVLLMLMLFQIIATMQEFNEVNVITGGGPGNSTITVLYLIYKYFDQYYNYGGACLLSAMLVVFLGIFSAAFLRLTRSHG